MKNNCFDQYKQWAKNKLNLQLESVRISYKLIELYDFNDILQLLVINVQLVVRILYSWSEIKKIFFTLCLTGQETSEIVTRLPLTP